jgi:hypothetical protein
LLKLRKQMHSNQRRRWFLMGIKSQFVVDWLYAGERIASHLYAVGTATSICHWSHSAEQGTSLGLWKHWMAGVAEVRMLQK